MRLRSLGIIINCCSSGAPKSTGGTTIKRAIEIQKILLDSNYRQCRGAVGLRLVLTLKCLQKFN